MSVARHEEVSGIPAASQFPDIDWKRIAYLLLASRALDEIEETRLVPEKRVLYQFSARGHDLAQIILGSLLVHPHDAANGYYRSRPLLLSLGLSFEDAFAAPMMRSGGLSDGRDIGVVFNLPNRSGPCVLPMCGGVGAQFTPIAGWAQAARYRTIELRDEAWDGAIGVALGGDGSVATNGFWSALTIATTEKLPMLFYIEDNGYGISVPSTKQTPGGNIARNLKSFSNLRVLDGDGTDPEKAASLIGAAVMHVRSGRGTALLRLCVPRLEGHSAQDTQGYRPKEELEQEWQRDPLPKLRQWLVPNRMSKVAWESLQAQAEHDVNEALERALSRSDPDPRNVRRHVFCETRPDGKPDLQCQGGLAPEGYGFPPSNDVDARGSARLNMVTAIRYTLDQELAVNPKLVLLGEDIGAKGGVHAATMGLQDKYGKRRVFDTSLSEEGIIGRSVGLALAGLVPVAEIQFRKYADPAEEQLNDCGTMRWRTYNRFAAPIVVRIPGGFFKCGDPWHSQTNEVKWVHAIGWRVAMPSNAEDAVGLLRTAMRGNDPTIFFEHRAMLDDVWARRPYPGDGYALPFGKARRVQEGNAVTIVTWGAMVPRCLEAAAQVRAEADILDLRTLMPWDCAAVLDSVRRTHRCVVVHEDNVTAGFGAEIAARLADETFFELDAPIRRVAMPDVPSPHHPTLMDAVVPSVRRIVQTLRETLDA